MIFDTDASVHACMQVAQAAIEVPVTAAPMVAASMQQLLECDGASAVGECATTLAYLAAGCLVRQIWIGMLCDCV